MKNHVNPVKPTSRLRRDLGTLESYAALIGILIGAGIFQVTSQAWALTGPSVILGYLVLTPAILATSIPYAAYLSTPLGREPGGEYLHIYSESFADRFFFEIVQRSEYDAYGAVNAPARMASQEEGPTRA